MKPRVGIGILNYNGAGLTIKCLDHLQRLDWPADRLDVVVVDNASKDNSVMRIRLAYPDVNLVISGYNRGFAGGSNLAIKSMANVDYVALLNNDALVEPGWLEPLVDVLERRPEVGAACSKILFAATYIDLELVSPSFRPIGTDSRDLGVKVSGMKVGQEDRIHKTHFTSGFWGKESGGGKQPDFRWTNGNAVLRVPFDEDDQGCTVRLRVSAETSKSLVIRAGQQSTQVEVGSSPTWVELDLNVKPYNMINNVGSDLVNSRNSADRGIFQPDIGQFDEPEQVFAWCGCSVLLSPRYLADVGVFDEKFFLYYEDFDLSWRGQRRGWSYAYVPESVVRHFHAATTGENSDLFNFYVWRNRLLVLVKNASTSVALKESVGFIVRVLRNLQADGKNRKLSQTSILLVRVLMSFLIHAPMAFSERVKLGMRNRRKPLRIGSIAP